MEVHHHSHTARKKWTHYFWEFLMLFLAVTLGFFVENWREHIIENRRAAELARSLYHELQRDSANLKEVQSSRLKRENCIQYLIQFIQDSNLTNPSNEFCVCMVEGLTSFVPATFEPRDAILVQLKSSGMLRYFKDPLFQDGLTELSFAISSVRTRSERERNYFFEYINPFLLQHLDQNWIGQIIGNREITVDSSIIEYRKNNRVYPCQFKHPDSIKKEEATDMLTYYYRMIIRHTRLSVYHSYETINHEMQMHLRSKYNL